MTRIEDGQLLARQLQEALREHAEGESFEIAVLAGLLSRTGCQDAAARAALTAAARLRDDGALTAGFPADEQIDEAADRLTALEDDADPEERADAVWELDELCAGAWFCGRAAEVVDAVDLAARTVAAFPASFQDLAELASAVLAKVPPLAGDPARRLWRAVEATALTAHDLEDGDAAPACLDARRRLGLVPRVSLRAVPERAPLRASGLPEEPLLVALLTAEAVEVALGVEAGVGRVLLIKARGGGAAPRLLRDGETVPLTDLREGLWCGPAQVGEHRLDIAGQEHLFEVVA